MRTSDENQRSSTRPHLKSARRLGAAADGNILAMLERIAGKPGVRAKKHNNAWLAAGAALVVLLVGVVAWLAHVNATTLRPLPVADARGRALPDVPPAEAGARLPAAIIDEPAERAVLLAQAGPPPLVMVKPATAALKPAPVVVERAPRPKPAAAKPAPPAARAAVAPVPKKQRPPAPKAEPEPEAVDSDIALLSAILAQSSRHAGERAQEEPKAPPKP